MALVPLVCQSCSRSSSINAIWQVFLLVDLKQGWDGYWVRSPLSDSVKLRSWLGGSFDIGEFNRWIGETSIAGGCISPSVEDFVEVVCLWLKKPWKRLLDLRGPGFVLHRALVCSTFFDRGRGLQYSSWAQMFWCWVLSIRMKLSRTWGMAGGVSVCPVQSILVQWSLDELRQSTSLGQGRRWIPKVPPEVLLLSIFSFISRIWHNGCRSLFNDLP